MFTVLLKRKVNKTTVKSFLHITYLAILTQLSKPLWAKHFAHPRCNFCYFKTYGVTIPNI